MQYRRISRHFHLWAALVILLPVLVVISTGILLQVKKEFDWIQPPTKKTGIHALNINFKDILLAASSVEEAQIKTWADIDRLDVRPNKGILKIQVRGNWEVQMDHQTGEVLSVSFRRSDIIESIHDGSFFHDKVKLAVFLPAATVLLILWVTGIYLFSITELAKWRSRKKQKTSKRAHSPHSKTPGPKT